MPREIKGKSEEEVLVSTSFDGKHSLQFKESSHRYKWTCPCHKAASAVGVSTFSKSGYITSMGLISWHKEQTGNAVFDALTVPGEDGYYPREAFWPIGKDQRIDIIKTAKLADKAVALEAADIGTITHGYAELHSIGKVNEAEELIDKVKGAEAFGLIRSCIDKYIAWNKTNQGSLVMAEALVAHPCAHHTEDDNEECVCFCGKFDRLDNVGGKLILRDYKTSKSIFLEQYIQLAAYSLAIEDWLGLKVEGLEVLRFGKDNGEFENLLVDDPREIKVFQEQALRCRDTHEFRKLENDPRWSYKK